LDAVNPDGTWVAKFSPIPVLSNPFCGGHSILGNGNILVAGGDNQSMPDVGTGQIFNGRQAVRLFKPCAEDAPKNCLGTWEDKESMTTERWYPTVLTLADGTYIDFDVAV
jgi:hypothetical protein